MPKVFGKGGKKKKKPPRTKPKPNHIFKKKKKKKRRPISKKGMTTYTITQPRKKKYTVHRPRLLKGRKPKRSFKSMSLVDSSSFSNIMGKKSFKRRSFGHKNMEGKESGIMVDQGNNIIRVQRFPN